MTTRELQPVEWSWFFDGFSRQHRGKRMTIEVVDAPDAQAHTLAHRLPLLGITAEPRRGQVESIEVMVGDSPVSNVVHVIRQPSHVRVAQITNGEDEMLIIDSASGPTTRIEFRPPTASGYQAAGADGSQPEEARA